MPYQEQMESCVSIQNYSTGAAGSGVVVFRDQSNGAAYVATCSHVITGMASGSVMDSEFRKYDSWTLIVNDVARDFAILRVADMPNSISRMDVMPTSQKLEDGTPVVVVGWSLAFDHNSLSEGIVRSAKWNMSEQDQILIAVPTFGGNSGGPVFTKDTKLIIGLVSWGIGDYETLTGLVPYWVIWESLMHYTYRMDAPVPLRFSFEEYGLGAQLVTLDAFTIRKMVNVTDPTIKTFAEAGYIVYTVSALSPAASVGLTSLSVSRGRYTFYIIWAIRESASDAWTYFNQNTSYDTVVRSFYHANYPFDDRIYRAKQATTEDPLDIRIPATKSVQLLTSRVVNGVHNNSYVVRPVSLVKRSLGQYQTLNLGYLSKMKAQSRRNNTGIVPLLGARPRALMSSEQEEPVQKKRTRALMPIIQVSVPNIKKSKFLLPVK